MAGSVLKVGEGLKELEIPSSTYYRWRRNFRKRGLVGLKDRRPIGKAGLELDSASETRQDIAHRVLLETNQIYNLTCPPSPVHTSTIP